MLARNRAEVAQARIERDSLVARLSGLQKKLSSQDEKILTVAADLREKHGEWAESVVTVEISRYVEAVAVFAAVVDQIRGVAEAVGRPLPGMDYIAVPHPHETQAGRHLISATNVQAPAYQSALTEYAGPLQVLRNITALESDVLARRSGYRQKAAEERQAAMPQWSQGSAAAVPVQAPYCDPNWRGTLWDPQHETAGMTGEQLYAWLEARNPSSTGTPGDAAVDPDPAVAHVASPTV